MKDISHLTKLSPNKRWIRLISEDIKIDKKKKKK